MPQVLIVAQGGPTDVGTHLAAGAVESRVDHSFFDSLAAYAASFPIEKVNWLLRGKRPSRLRWSSKAILERCREERPAVLLATGFAPIDAGTLEEIGRLGVHRINFSTDDPWNEVHYAPWFLRCLPHYDVVFTPRRANMRDLEAAGCRARYLPFAYSPAVHFPEPISDPVEGARLRTDVVFVGAADKDRVPYFEKLIDHGLSISLYGKYWERFEPIRNCARGEADLSTMRKVTGSGAVSLCLVRRANRDGMSMRSFEVPAMGGCPLVEDTPEHRDLFGPEGDAVAYFSSPDEAARKAKRLRELSEERERLSVVARQLVVGGDHTYRHRLETMLADCDRQPQ